MRLLFLEALIVLAGCAASPDDIKPAVTNPTPYQAYDCRQLHAEAARLEAALPGEVSQQEDARTYDIISNLTIGFPVSGILGEDVEDQIAADRGKLGAVRQAIRTRGCDDPNAARPYVPN